MPPRSPSAPPRGAAVASIDFYGRAAVDHPAFAYRPILDAGPVVCLPEQQVLAVARWAPLRTVLEADSHFVSSQGVTMNPLLDRATRSSASTG